MDHRYEQELIVNANELQQVCSQIYQQVGVTKSAADAIADADEAKAEREALEAEGAAVHQAADDALSRAKALDET